MVGKIMWGGCGGSKRNAELQGKNAEKLDVNAEKRENTVELL